jgi:asparagine synthase (glutamine-hydrolysing)
VCGIAGIANRRGLDPGSLPAMADALRHRGPDGEGYALIGGDGTIAPVPREALEPFASGPATVGFAHRRLTILDTTDAGAQPMIDRGSGVALIYNGELYNYVELRADLEALGHRLRSTGDTEVLLRAWIQWGPSCVERFVGMWAFALADMRRRELVLCRDRFGIKPLFWQWDGQALRFASEIKALLAVTPTPEPDDATVGAFLLAASDTERETFFSGVERLEPATMLTLSLADGSPPRLHRYWDLPSMPQSEPADAAERYAELFTDSVRVHTRSDVPVGTCLSGGIDSSSIVCVASNLRRRGALPPAYRHHAFGYVPVDESASERDWMKLVVGATGIDFTEVRPARDRFASALQTIVSQQDEPFSSTSIVAQWFVFEAARAAGIKVMLDGQGADEVLGGYHGYLVTIAAGMVRDQRRLAFARLSLDYRRRLKAWPLPWGTASALLPSPALALASAGARLRPARGELSVPTVVDTMTDGLRRGARETRPLETEMNALLRQQTLRGGMRSLLRYEDRNAMAHSIESRVPFLDHRLVEFVFSLPAEARVRGAETKRILREAMKGVLPEPIRTRRDKIGFAADPGAAARFAADRRSDLVANQTALERRWFEPRGVDRLIDAAQVDGSHEFALWRVINVKLWAREHWGHETA